MNTKTLIFNVFFVLIIPMSRAQIGIGTTTPEESAILDVSSTTKGLLIPRVTLNDKSTSDPVSSPTDGLLIYNSNGAEPKGFYYWRNNTWNKMVSLNTGSDEANSILVSNGIQTNGNKIELGGDLIKNTTINNNGNDLNISGNGELQISNAEDPVLRIHSSANETNKGGRIEFNESDTSYGYVIRHQTGGGLVNSSQREDGLWFEMKKDDVYTPAFGFGDNGGNSQPRIGVLTTSPKTDFHTIGTGLFQNGTSSASIGGTTYLSENNQLSLENPNNGSVVQYFQSTGDNSKSVKLGLNPTFSDGVGVFSIQTAQDGVTYSDKMTILMDGKVGIGVSNPQNNLHIANKEDVIVYLEADNTNGNENNNPFIKMSQDNKAINAEVGMIGDTGSGFYSGENITGSLENALIINHTSNGSNPGKVQIANNKAVALTVVNGKTGIGTNNPKELLDVDGILVSNTYKIDNISSTPNGEQSRNIVYNPDTKILEVEPKNAGAITFTSLTDGSTFAPNTGNSNAVFKLYIQTGNACGHTVINEYQVAGSNLNGSNWEIKAIAGISTNGSATLNQVNSSTVNVVNSRESCGDGSSQNSFNYSITVSGSGVFTLSGTSGTFKAKFERIF